MTKQEERYNTFAKAITTNDEKLRPYDKIDLMIKNEILLQLTRIADIQEMEMKV